MVPFLQKLPTILVLCVLLGIFLSLRKHARSRPIGLCVLGWALVLVHFVAQGFEALPGLPGQISNTVDLAGLELAGVAFIAFTTKSIVEHRRRQIVFCLAIGLPALFHSL